MTERLQSPDVFRADAAAEQERRLAAVSVEYRPVESFSGTAVGRGFRIEKEVGTGGFVSGGRFEVARRPDPERFDNTESPILQSEASSGVPNRAVAGKFSPNSFART